MRTAPPLSRSRIAARTIGALIVLFAASGPGRLATAQWPDGQQVVSRGTPVVLFDGKSLEGWGRRDGSSHDGWIVEDGALARKSGGGDLYFRYPLRDFELWFEWRIGPGGNSGLKYRVQEFDGSWLGCEYQILDDENGTDANKSAGLYDVFDPPSWRPRVVPGQWQSGRIVVCGNRIEHWLNGVQTVRAYVGSEAWKQAVADSKFAGTPGFGENRTGRLFLQDHGDPVWFRNLVLVPLDCDAHPVCGAEWLPPSPVCCGPNVASARICTATCCHRSIFMTPFERRAVFLGTVGTEDGWRGRRRIRY
jgi:hypothetical protein